MSQNEHRVFIETLNNNTDHPCDWYHLINVSITRQGFQSDIVWRWSSMYLCIEVFEGYLLNGDIIFCRFELFAIFIHSLFKKISRNDETNDLFYVIK